MQLHEIDPLHDSRWRDLVERSSTSSIFHTSGWLTALQQTYRYQPVVFTDAAPGQPLQNAVLFCRVKSWLTGRRLVSLPFSDHCEPLAEPDALRHMLEAVKEEKGQREGRYVEMRPLTARAVGDVFRETASFCHHVLDLTPDLDTLFSRFHRNHVQRTIRRAERLGVRVESGRSEELLECFYRLHTLTRRRHAIPVQPYGWFRNVIQFLGERADILVARVDERPIAAMITTTHKRTLTFKYGCSDAAMHRYGGMALLFWTAICHSKQEGYVAFDFGRSDQDDHGLIAYKDHFGARRTSLVYYRDRAGQPRGVEMGARDAFRLLLPSVLQVNVGRAFYRHLG